MLGLCKIILSGSNELKTSEKKTHCTRRKETILSISISKLLFAEEILKINDWSRYLKKKNVKVAFN